MSVRSAQAITVEFITSNPSTKAALNADSTPTGTLVLNGVDNGASVTVTNVDTGRYKAAVTLPTLAIGDIVELSIAATVSTITGKAIVWRDTKDVLLDSSGDVTFNNTSIATVTTLSNLPAAPTDWLAAAAVKADAVTKIQAGLATPTNITAGTITTTTNLTNAPTAGDLTATMKASITTAVPTTTTISAAVWNEINTGATHNVNNSTGKQLRSAGGTTAGATGVIYTATAPSQAGMTSTQIKLDSGASALNDVYQWDVISIVSGTDQGDSTIITAYNGTTKIATVRDAWTVQPNNTSVFEITPTPVFQVLSPVTVGTNNDKAGYSLAVAPPTAVAIADAVLIRDWTAVVGAVADRSTLNALRFLRNRWSLSGSTLTVYDEVGGPAWTSTVTATPGADPVTATNPS